MWLKTQIKDVNITHFKFKRFELQTKYAIHFVNKKLIILISLHLKLYDN